MLPGKENLEWVTNLGNQRHFRDANPMFYRGISNPMTPFTDEDILEIREMATYMSRNAISKIYGVACGTICNIVNRKHWTHI